MLSGWVEGRGGESAILGSAVLAASSEAVFAASSEIGSAASAAPSKFDFAVSSEAVFAAICSNFISRLVPQPLLIGELSLFLLLHFLQHLSLFHLGGMLTAFTCLLLAIIETKRSLFEGEGRRFLHLAVSGVRGVSHGLICVLLVVGGRHAL